MNDWNATALNNARTISVYLLPVFLNVFKIHIIFGDQFFYKVVFIRLARAARNFDILETHIDFLQREIDEI